MNGQIDETSFEQRTQSDQYLAMLGHELRNPLAAIVNATELLKLFNSEDSELGEIKEVLERQTQFMKNLVDGLLDMTRISVGKIPLDKKPVNISSLIDEVVADHLPQARLKNLTLQVETSDHSLWVKGDRTRLTQTLDNLVDNAIKFTPVHGKIQIHAAHLADQVVVEISDTGVGIDPELIARVFEPFTQGDQAIDRGDGGLGLGLSIAHGLLALHEGTLSIESEGLGEGTLVRLSLPFFDYCAEQSTPEERATAFSSRKILVVEDNMDAAILLKRILTKFGQRVELVHNGHDALDSIQHSTPDLVLCDIGLPGGLDGYQVAKSIRCLPSLASTPLIAVTGYGTKEDVDRAISSGFNCHLTKPINFKVLENLLQELN